MQNNAKFNIDFPSKLKQKFAFLAIKYVFDVAAVAFFSHFISAGRICFLVGKNRFSLFTIAILYHNHIGLNFHFCFSFFSKSLQTFLYLLNDHLAVSMETSYYQFPYKLNLVKSKLLKIESLLF